MLTPTSVGLVALLGAVAATRADAQQQPAADPNASDEQKLYGSKEAAGPDPSPVVPESAESLVARVRAARLVAAEQRRAALAAAPSTEGLTPSQLEIRGAEENLSIYDLQILRGEGTPAIESFRKITLSTLADARRKELRRIWGDAIFHPEAIDVLTENARTRAELRRIQLLARLKGVSALVKKSDALMEQVALGFHREMQRLRDEVRDNPSFARLSVELHDQTTSGAQH